MELTDTIRQRIADEFRGGSVVREIAANYGLTNEQARRTLEDLFVSPTERREAAAAHMDALRVRLTAEAEAARANPVVMFKAMLADVGDPLTPTRWAQWPNRPVSASRVRQLLGSHKMTWREAVVAAGGQPVGKTVRRSDRTDRSVVEAAMVQFVATGERTQRAYETWRLAQSPPPPTVWTVRSTLGCSWSEAVSWAAGVKRPRNRQLTPPANGGTV